MKRPSPDLKKNIRNEDSLACVQAALIGQGLATPEARYVPMPGGRTNRLWRYDYKGNTLVCKLFANRGTPLFPNSADHEAAALTRLQNTGLAPQLVAKVDSDAGPILIYRHVLGPNFGTDTAPVATSLKQLHALQPPEGLRKLKTNTILAQGAAILETQTRDGHRLAQLRPPEPDLPPAPPVFLHGDVVADNIIETPHGICLIDWQCPAVGDRTEDLAIFLSPAMQHVNGRIPLSKTQEATFLAAYGHPDATERYRVLVPAYHWRMAAYCLWKAQAGDLDYLEGFQLEIARLETLR